MQNIDPDQISFAEWLVELNALAVKSGYKGQPLVEITGQLEWLYFYESETSPANALKIAENDGIRFGADYCD
ncbi:MAG: hypothetical protein WCD70_13460 [Alphaproteobacteria bacterium]